MYHYRRPEDVGFVKYLSETNVYNYFHYRRVNDYFHYHRVNEYFHDRRKNDDIRSQQFETVIFSSTGQPEMHTL